MADSRMIFSNFRMEYYTNLLIDFLDNTGRFGYAIARNYRNLSESLQEYLLTKRELIEEYGTEDVDEEGNPLGSYTIRSGDPNYQEVNNQLRDLGSIIHEVTIFKITYDDLPEDLSARDIISLEWMIED